MHPADRRDPDPRQERGRDERPHDETVEDEEGQVTTYRIVGPDEIDASNRWISMHSPMGRALLSRNVGDEVSVQRPKGDLVYEIVEVRNSAPAGE